MLLLIRMDSDTTCSIEILKSKMQNFCFTKPTIQHLKRFFIHTIIISFEINFTRKFLFLTIMSSYIQLRSFVRVIMSSS